MHPKDFLLAMVLLVAIGSVDCAFPSSTTSSGLAAAAAAAEAEPADAAEAAAQAHDSSVALNSALERRFLEDSCQLTYAYTTNFLQYVSQAACPDYCGPGLDWVILVTEGNIGSLDFPIPIFIYSCYDPCKMEAFNCVIGDIDFTVIDQASVCNELCPGEELTPPTPGVAPAPTPGVAPTTPTPTFGGANLVVGLWNFILCAVSAVVCWILPIC